MIKQLYGGPASDYFRHLYTEPIDIIHTHTHTHTRTHIYVYIYMMWGFMSSDVGLIYIYSANHTTGVCCL